jgi:hypothetical protein
MSIDPAGGDLSEVSRFIERNAKTWSIREDLVSRAKPSAQQAVASVIDHCFPSGPIKLSARYDEFDIVIRITYRAPELEFCHTPPSRDDIIASSECHRRFAGYLVARHADHAVSEGGHSAIMLRFRH